MKKMLRLLWCALVCVLVGCGTSNGQWTSDSPSKEKDVTVAQTTETDAAIAGQVAEDATNAEASDQTNAVPSVVKGESYYDRDDVAAYIYAFQELPPNYLTKKEARERDWEPNDGSGWVVGGDRFGNREGLLPDAPKRKYYEADVAAGYTDDRGAERLVYSNDGLIFYTADHYETFEQLYNGREEPEE